MGFCMAAGAACFSTKGSDDRCCVGGVGGWGVQRVLVAFHHSASAAGQNNKPFEAHGEHFHSDTAGWNQNNLQDAQNKPDDINTHDK